MIICDLFLESLLHTAAFVFMGTVSYPGHLQLLKILVIFWTLTLVLSMHWLTTTQALVSFDLPSEDTYDIDT